MSYRRVIVNTNLIKALASIPWLRQATSRAQAYSIRHSQPLDSSSGSKLNCSQAWLLPNSTQSELLCADATRPCSVRHSQRYFHDWSLLGHNWCPLLSRRRLSRHCCSWKKSRWNNRCGQTAPSLYLHVLIGTRQRAHPNSS